MRPNLSIWSHPVEAFGLKGMTAGVVKLPPASSATPIYRLYGQREIGVNVYKSTLVSE